MGEQSEVTTGIYCRISLASIGDTTKTDDQERICRDLADRLGWTVAEVYTDHSQSAWKRNRKRDDWDRMLADVNAGKISGIIVYHGDRLIRQPWDLEVLLSLADSKGVRLASPTGVRSLDNADDRFILRIEAAQACRQSDDTSRRKKAGFERMRRQGLARPGGAGGRAFGFAKDGRTHVPAETAIIRETAGAVLAGQSLGSVTRQLAARGVTTVTGKPISQDALQRILRYPRMAGLMPDGVSRAAWEPVLEREEWEELQAVLAASTRIPNRGKGALHLLSGLARCGAGACGHVLWAGGSAGGPSYKCMACSKVSRNIVLLDAYVSAMTAGRLGLEANPQPRQLKNPGLAAEFAALTEARAELEEVLADHARGRLPVLLARLDSLDKRLAELRDMAADGARARLLAQYAGIGAEGFGDLPLHVRRSLVGACFDVIVLPSSRRGSGFRTEDVQLTPR